MDDVRDDLEHLGVVGLKPYPIYSTTGDPYQHRIEKILTHEQMELTDELGLGVTMHLSQTDGCADEKNLEDALSSEEVAKCNQAIDQNLDHLSGANSRRAYGGIGESAGWPALAGKNLRRDCHGCLTWPKPWCDSFRLSWVILASCRISTRSSVTHFCFLHSKAS